jgi:DNA-binding response OmpR family regulator
MATLHSPGRVLVVEDDVLIRELITILLTDEGYDVVCAEESAAALQLAQREQPDVILLDLSLPGVSGDKIISAYRLLPNATASIIVVSGRSNLERIALQAGADAYVAKPFDLGVLLNTIESVLSRRTHRRCEQQPRHDVAQTSPQ